MRWLADELTVFCLWVVCKLNRHKDDRLAYAIHCVAGLFQRRPQEGWRPPAHWPKD